MIKNWNIPLQNKVGHKDHFHRTTVCLEGVVYWYVAKKDCIKKVLETKLNEGAKCPTSYNNDNGAPCWKRSR